MLVLLGLWLMHGVSATTGAGCHGVPVMMSMSMSASAAEPGSIMAATPTMRADHQVQAKSADSMPTGSGETCLSGQPPSPRDLLLGLLACLVLAVLGRVVPTWPPHAASCAACRPRRRGPPGRAGRVLLTTVCISRT
jgi:hypothetical protein